MKDQQALQWVRLPLQTRSQKTLERLIEAAEELLRERDFESVSVSEIAQRANSSVGAFYARFRDKLGLLHFMHERFAEEAMATAEESMDPQRWEGYPMEEILSAVTALMVRVHRDRAGLLRAFMMYGCKDEKFRVQGERVWTHLNSQLRALLLPRLEAINHPHPTPAITFGLYLVMSVLNGIYIQEEGTLIEGVSSDEDLHRELLRAYLGYLGGTLSGVGSAPPELHDKDAPTAESTWQRKPKGAPCARPARNRQG